MYEEFFDKYGYFDIENELKICGKIVKLLLKNGADPNIQNKNGQTVLHMSLLNLPVIKLLLSHKSTNPNIQDNNGNTILHLSTFREVFPLEIDNGDPYENSIEEVRRDCINYIINSDADLNIRNNAGETPFYNSMWNYYDSMIMSNTGKADSSIRCSLGYSPKYIMGLILKRSDEMRQIELDEYGL